jgi:hypothetical protein
MKKTDKNFRTISVISGILCAIFVAVAYFLDPKRPSFYLLIEIVIFLFVWVAHKDLNEGK